MFGAYQLNTMVLHSHHISDNPRRNVCWTTEPMQLFDKVENNKVHGLNDEVLGNIVKFYLNEPRSRDGVEMKPYLHPDVVYVANSNGSQRRTWLEERFKLMASNRPRHRLVIDAIKDETTFFIFNYTFVKLNYEYLFFIQASSGNLQLAGHLHSQKQNSPGRQETRTMGIWYQTMA